MQPANPPEKVYHGTDAASAASIEQGGLDQNAWYAAAGASGPDPKGFSVSANRLIAEDWAAFRAGERRSAEGVILEAAAGSLSLQTGSPGQWTDPNEFFIRPEDFPQVGPGVFRNTGKVNPIP